MCERIVSVQLIRIMKKIVSIPRARILLFTGLALLFFSSCKDEQPITYQIPKEKHAAQVASLSTRGNLPADTNKMQVLPGMEEEAAAAPDIRFTLPEGWTDAGATVMRKANLRVSEEQGSAEITALIFPGDVGGRIANINRWRNQIGLDPVTPEDLPEFTEICMISGHRGLYIKLKSEPKSLLGVILPFHGQTWFFKMIGDSETVFANETAMKVFLDSVTIEDTHH